jgi:hypothetical protein
MSRAQQFGRTKGEDGTVAQKTERKAPNKAKKKPWERPRVKSGRLFESNSLACGKNQYEGNADMCGAMATIS